MRFGALLTLLIVWLSCMVLVGPNWGLFWKGIWVYLIGFLLAYIIARIVSRRHQCIQWLHGNRVLRTWGDISQDLVMSLYSWGYIIEVIREWILDKTPPRWL